MTSSPASRAAAAVRSSAVQPGAPSRSKQASWSLAATQAGPAASISAAQWFATASAAASAGLGPAGAAADVWGHRRAGSGSSPRTSCVCRSATRPASRSPKPVRAGSAVDGLLELRPGAETRDPRRRDVDRLPGAWMLAGASAPLGHVELAEAGEGNLAPATERRLDRIQDGVDGLLRVLLGEIGVLRDLIDEFRLRHLLLLRGRRESSKLTTLADDGWPSCRRRVLSVRYLRDS